MNSSLYCLLIGIAQLSLCSAVKPAPEKGQNVCAYDRNKTVFSMRRNSTTLKTTTSRKCKMPGYEKLMCRESKYETRIFWYPEKSERHYIEYDCCPGWMNYIKGVGCLQVKTCEVKISQKSQGECKSKRQREIAGVQKIYRLGSIAKMPFAVTDIDVKQVIGMHLNDPFTAELMRVYISMLTLGKGLIDKFSKMPLGKKEFTSTTDYENVYKMFIAQIKAIPKFGKYFRFPFESLPFKSVINNHTWREDSVFTQMRLAGLNPMCIQRVTFSGDIGVPWANLVDRLNPDFDWNKAMQRAAGQSLPLPMIIGSGSVFVCQYPLFDDLVNTVDITEPRPTRKMWKSTSPIAVFVSRQSLAGHELVPAAVQMDSKQDSPVYTPADGDLWMLAKEALQVTDFAYVEMVEHLLKTHLMMEPFCTTIQRHLSSLHPIHQIMKYHCRGLLPNNKIGLPKLINDKAYMHNLFAIGNTGSLQLLIRAYHTMTWQDTDFLYNIKRRGVDDKKKLPYFPYRDDGELLYRSMHRFVTEYVLHYYGTDADILADQELQALANEMSSEGTGEDGGKGKLRGFPSTIPNRFVLADIITRLIWTSSAQHSAVNYPVTAYGAFTPSTPTKIYDDARVPENTFNLYRLPNGNISAIQAGVAISLGSLHYDDLLDYGQKLTDREGRKIVTKHYKWLMTQVKDKMDTRNRERFNDGYLTYPFLTPGWVPNSICT